MEACASAPLFALLKREDEKWVTEHAYDNPRFVEDLIREVTASLRPRARSLRVTVENVESIHNHSAWARLAWQSEAGEEPEAKPTAGTGNAAPAAQAAPTPSFGSWLAARRSALHLTQAQLAERLAVSESWVCKLEAGQRALGADHVAALANALGEAPERLAALAGVFTAAQLARVRSDPEGFLRWAGG